MRDSPFPSSVAPTLAPLLALVLTAGCRDAIDPPAVDVAASREPAARHLLLVTIDTLRADHLGIHGGRPGVSPAIDALAAEGTRFENCHAPMGMTLACMTAMFTSKAPDETGVRSNLHRLRDDEWTLAERLADAGFRCRGFTANGVLQPGKSGIDQGFVEHRRIEDESWLTHLAAKTILEDFGNDAAQRDFLWVHYMDPHQPYQRREPFATEFDPDYDGPFDAEEETLQRIFVDKVELSPRDLEHVEAVYDSQVRRVDQFVQSLVGALRMSGHEDDTLVVFSADHGEDLYDHNRYFYHANSLYGSVTHVPLVFRQPGAIPAGERVGDLVELIDVLPTIVAHLGFDPRSGDSRTQPRGTDLGPSMHGAAVGKGFAFAQVADQAYAVRSPRWFYVENPRGYMPRSIPAEGEYFIGKRELFDLEADPGEQTNVVHGHPDVAEKMAKALATWRASLAASDSDEQELTDEERANLEALGYLAPDKKDKKQAEPSPTPDDG